MNRVEQAAWLAAFTAAWVAYAVVRAVASRIGIKAWRDAWNRVPVESRAAFRDALMTEEGIISDGD